MTQLVIQNYCISFLDILGMKQTLKGQGLLPVDTSSVEHAQFETSARDSIGAIMRLQNIANQIIETTQQAAKESVFSKQLSGEKRAAWEQMSYTRVQMQPWSDGLVYFTNLGDEQQKCSVNAIYEILVTAGILYMNGLVLGYPLRGGIDIAWAAELQPGNLYGAALARAYELESEVAQYPRIVVHNRVAECLQAAVDDPGTDVFTQYSRDLASATLTMLSHDVDNMLIVDVLGSGYKKYLGGPVHADMYEKGRNFVIDQLDKFRASGNTKLALRYSHLLTYFDENPP